MPSDLRFTSAVNPLGLRLGERISVRRTCEVDYDDTGEKKLYFNQSGTPVSCVVVGSVKKALGTYHKGHRHDHMGLEYNDDPPRLNVSKYVRLYECRVVIDKKPFLVHPDDVILD